MNADQLESLLSAVLSKTIPEIISKVLEKFDTCFEKLMAKFDDKLDHYYGALHDVNARLDKLERSFVDVEKSCADIRTTERSVATSRESGSTQVDKKSDPTLQVLMAMEMEKTERAKRQRNIIITGLPEVPGTTDEAIFSKFCEDNLTIKPRPVHCRRIGQAAGDKPKKLKVTLDTDTAVEDLILSSHMLRGPNSTQRQVYFNRDLTPMESQAAFEHRQLRKLSSTHTKGSVDSTLNPDATSFPAKSF